MDKNTIMLVVIFLLLGVITGFVLSNNLLKQSDEIPTGTVTYSGVEPSVIGIGRLDINGINKIEIKKDQVICYIKVGQGAGISCIPMKDLE